MRSIFVVASATAVFEFLPDNFLCDSMIRLPNCAEIIKGHHLEPTDNNDNIIM